jgi:DNA modification methylase
MTELTWQGKYQDGKKTAPVRLALPFQTIETINESAADRQKRLASLFGQQPAPPQWRNRLIWGDKKYVLPSLLPEFAGQVNLIYIDPPFNVGSDFSFTATLGDHPDDDDLAPASFTKQPSIIEQKAYRDTWGRGLDSYLQWFYETALLLRELLADNGSIYVHLDWHVGHYAKCVLDEVFGYENFVNEIIWKRQSAKSGSFGSISQFGRIHEVIYYYSKSENRIWNQLYLQYEEEYVVKNFKNVDPNSSNRFSLRDLTAAGVRNGDSGKPIFIEGEEIKVPSGRHWAVGLQMGESVQQAVDRLYREDKIWFSKGKMPRLKLFLNELSGVPLQSIWTDISPVQSQSNERVDYATQKPEALLERIIRASSHEGDLVLDCFCGSGTTAATAERLGRRWITADLGRFAIHTARKRLLGVAGVRPFWVQNLGKYERQQWLRAEFADPAGRLEQEQAYKKFICDLYHAQPLAGRAWLHGSRAGRLVHIGSVEAPVTVADIKATILEFWQLVGHEKALATNGIDFLGWDFAFDVNETAAQFAASNKVDVRFKKIPREVLEKKAVEQGDIRFYELASVEVQTAVAKNQLTVTLANFIVPPDDLPAEVRGSISHWSQWVDYWSIDWNHRDDTFHNEWQSYRTKANPKLALSATRQYDQPGRYQVLVKVIDILGNDTTKLLKIEIN